MIEKKVIDLPNGDRIEYYSKKLWLTGLVTSFRDHYNEKGLLIYRICSGWWQRWEFNDKGEVVYYENSGGMKKILS